MKGLEPGELVIPEKIVKLRKPFEPFFFYRFLENRHLKKELKSRLLRALGKGVKNV